MQITIKLILLFICASAQILHSKENINIHKTNLQKNTGLAVCMPSVSASDLDIGNVRARILINGDMWWDLVGTAIYEVPKGSGKNSMFAGALWIGGKDNANNLKLAAQTYRQSGSDFWPGTLDTTTNSITAARCSYYDKHWKITRQEVQDFINGSPASIAIINWPGNGDMFAGEANFLAPFYDHNGDGIYDYTNGDYPKYDFGTLPPGPNMKLNGDQTIWWVFNDVGNLHMESGSPLPLGIEIRGQAYAFCTNDNDLSNTTFYSYELINRTHNILNETYIGHFTDADLGNYLDDYVGCDVGRNMGYTYNGDNNDDGATGYGTILPAIGVDLLQGPLADPNDSIDNNRNGVIDEFGEQVLMSKFVYYNNNATVTGNPTFTADYYNYLDGKWLDNSPILYGGTGYLTPAAPNCNFMFPGDSDPMHTGTNGTNPGFEWTEQLPCPTCLPNSPNDRRFLMSSGRFTMLPGQVSRITKAAIWAQNAGGIDSSLAGLRRADDKIQNFFDSNFTSITTCNINPGVNEINSDDIKIYPVPAVNYVSIELQSSSTLKTIVVYTARGKLIERLDKLNNDRIEISTLSWAAGNYFLNIIDQRNLSVTRKITIIKD